MQQKIYDYLVACIQAQGYPPSVREIGEAVGLRSPSTVHFHLKHLAEMGYIEIGAGKGRAISLVQQAAPLPEPEEPDRIPIVGNVAHRLLYPLRAAAAQGPHRRHPGRGPGQRPLPRPAGPGGLSHDL